MKTKTLKPAGSSSSKSWVFQPKSDILPRLRLRSSKKLWVESVSRVCRAGSCEESMLRKEKRESKAAYIGQTALRIIHRRWEKSVCVVWARER